MSVHYQNPVLLIEFEEDKAFSLEVNVAAVLCLTPLLNCHLLSDDF